MATEAVGAEALNMASTKQKPAAIWYPRYPGDYGRKTAHLSLAEHGAYALLMDHAYSNGGSLPASAVQLHRICRAFASDEQDACMSVVQQFFTLVGDEWRHVRIDEELARRGEISEKRSAAAKSRYANGNANAEQKQVQLHTQSQSQSHNNPLPPLRGGEFDIFWNAYPHRNGQKKNRKGAEAKFVAAVKRGVDVATIMAGVEAMKHLPDVKRGFARDPVTWINQAGWEDVAPSPQEYGKMPFPELDEIRTLPDGHKYRWGGAVDGWMRQR